MPCGGPTVGANGNRWATCSRWRPDNWRWNLRRSRPCLGTTTSLVFGWEIWSQGYPYPFYFVRIKELAAEWSNQMIGHEFCLEPDYFGTSSHDEVWKISWTSHDHHISAGHQVGPPCSSWLPWLNRFISKCVKEQAFYSSLFRWLDLGPIYGHPNWALPSPLPCFIVFWWNQYELFTSVLMIRTNQSVW